ncbi:MAG: nucleotidyltransferase family protein [Clostridia bacterium]|nr:nucleotidyltransferase family protein [Clostridia bacterium]
MIKEIKTKNDYLIHLIFSAIHNKIPIEKPNNISFEDVFETALNHNVANTAYYAVEKLTVKPKNDLLKKWKYERERWILKDINQRIAREEIVTAFNKKGILYIEAQGTKIKEFYPQSDFRTMSDLDFIVNSTDFSKVKPILKKLDYLPVNITEKEIDALRKPDIFIEIHSDFFVETECKNMLFNAFAHVEYIEEKAVLKNEYLFLYSFLHFYKHFSNRGCGIRNILDIYLLNKKLSPIINGKFVEEKLEEYGLYELYVKVSNLANNWFDDIIENKEDLSGMADYVFECGVYGNSNVLFKNRIRKIEKEGKKFAKLRIIFKDLFLDKNTICAVYNVERYKSLLCFPLSVCVCQVKMLAKGPQKC